MSKLNIEIDYFYKNSYFNVETQLGCWTSYWISSVNIYKAFIRFAIFSARSRRLKIERPVDVFPVDNKFVKIM